MTNDSIHWVEDEQKMFQQWLKCEKKEWGKFEYGDFEEKTLGVENSEIRSNWLPTMYQRLLPYKKYFDYLYTYVYVTRDERIYFVDVRYQSFMFRITISINKNKFYSDLFFKQNESQEYWTIKSCEKLEKKFKEGFKTGFEIVCELYENLKDFVRNEATNRLLILMNGLVLSESGVVRTKNIIDRTF